MADTATASHLSRPGTNVFGQARPPVSSLPTRSSIKKRYGLYLQSTCLTRYSRLKRHLSGLLDRPAHHLAPVQTLQMVARRLPATSRPVFYPINPRAFLSRRLHGHRNFARIPASRTPLTVQARQMDFRRPLDDSKTKISSWFKRFRWISDGPPLSQRTVL